jgi:2-iminoacetate synthase
MPFSSITISTRECERFRNNVIDIAATKISAGVSVGIGERTQPEDERGDEQFEIADGRNVEEVYNAIVKKGLQPVMSDYIYV